MRTLQTAKLGGKRRLVEADARNTGLEEGAFQAGLFAHPPYFALYRYSSDVLRFELEWMNYSRKKTAAAEIEDGFKTTDETLVKDYVRDLIAVAVEARRTYRQERYLCGGYRRQHVTQGPPLGHRPIHCGGRRGWLETGAACDSKGLLCSVELPPFR